MSDEHYLKRELYDRIRADSELFEFLQAGSLDGIWYWDLEHPEHEWMSPRFWELLGYEPTAMEHKASAWQHIINQEDLEVATANLEAHCADPSHAYDQIVRYRHKDGSTVWVRCRGVAIRNANSRPIRMLGAHNDVTALKRAEKIREDFLATISHELRTPLTSIVGSLRLVEGGAVGDLPPQMKELISVAVQNSERLTGLVDDLLDVQKLLFEPLTMDLEDTPVAPLLREAVKVDAPFAESHGVGLELAPNLPDRLIRVDRRRFQQVMSNLLSNAVKHSPEGGLVQVAAEASDVAVRIRVTDQGNGIPEPFRERVFERFSMADSSSTRPVGGAGLGLAFSRAIVRGFGGDISFETATGKGTSFFVEVPTADADPELEELRTR